VKYTGWGALSNLFAPYPPYDSRAIADELKAALSDEEYASARASTPNAHYTSPESRSGDVAGHGAVWIASRSTQRHEPIR
jgi:hypothetical protein